MNGETRYARSGEISVAYRVVGQGPLDIVYVPGFVSNVELELTKGPMRWYLSQLASFARLIVFDKRGTGMSDRVAGAPSLETRMDDVRAVLDAVGSMRAAIVGVSEGGPMSILFAATYPERTSALVLIGSFPRTLSAPDYPWGFTEREWLREVDKDARLFGTREEAIRHLMEDEGVSFSETEAGEFLDYVRQSASPGAARAIALLVTGIDVRHVLPTIRVPTLMFHGQDEWLPSVRWMANQIPAAQLTEFPGSPHILRPADQEAAGERTEQFLREVWEARAEDERDEERVLATVLFTDIVGSTERAAELGDRGWGDLLRSHHDLVRRLLARYRGREVDTAGDGFFASFDGPARAIRCAVEINQSMDQLGLQVRTGLHTGECEIVDGKVAGIAVHTGARVASQAGPGEILVSSTVKDLVAGSGIAFTDRGTQSLKGIPGEWHLFAVDG